MALTKKEVNSIYRRSLVLQASHNYERFQSLGYLYSMVPVLKKAYKDKPKAELSQAMHRHLEFFNTAPCVVQPILGVTAAMEDEEGNRAGEAISGIKIAMMGPLAGIGDSLIYMTVMLICLLLAVTFGSEGNPVGLILYLLLWNAFSQTFKFVMMKTGYREGTKLIERIKTSDLISRFSFMASVIGVTMVGGLIVQLVNVQLGFEVEGMFSLQGMLDGILPSMFPMGFTLLAFWLMKKKKVKPIYILLGIIVVSILGTLVGLFVVPT